MCRVVAAVGITTRSYNTIHYTTLHYTAKSYTILYCPAVLHSISGCDGDHQSYTIYYQLYINCSCSTVPSKQSYTILHYPAQLHICYAVEKSYNILFYTITDPLTTGAAQSYYSTPMHNYCSSNLNPQYFCRHQSVAHN